MSGFKFLKMEGNNLISEILRLKKERDAIILAHNYQRGEIQDIADYIGDSLGLARVSAELPHSRIVFCGVRFMAETAKILSPDKTVLLPREEAGCPMADMVTVEELKRLKAEYPNAKVVSYVNTNADVKAESDVCCTSANAVKVIMNMEAQWIIFTPDRNLASWVQRFTNKKHIIPWNGYCYVHRRIKKEDVLQAKQLHPDALLLVHPECDPEVIDIADEVLSTSGIVRFAKESRAKKFLIGTEEGIIYRLKKENPDKEFYAASRALMCHNMKLTRLEDLYYALLEDRYKIEVPEEIQRRAKRALDKMLEYV